MVVKRLLLLTAGLGFVALLAWLAVAYVQPRREARALRDSVRAKRMAVDSCRMVLSREEADFRAYDDRVDSLRGRVREYEDLHPEGVPADSFEAYMETFGRYNEAVPRWEARAESLRGRWRVCRSLASQHNALVDSLRDLLVEIGELPDSVGESDEASD